MEPSLPQFLVALVLHLTTTLSPIWVERDAYLMGTTLQIVVAAPTRAAGIAAIEKAFEAVRQAEDRLSTWRQDSEVARVNHAPPGQPVALSPALSRVLHEAGRWYQLTDGAFDPAVGPLIDAWDLRGKGKVPSTEALARARAASGWRNFSWSDGGRTVRRADRMAWIDTGGFGKGVALRDAREALRGAGIASAFLNFGGQVLAFGGNRDGSDWIVPVAHPSRRFESVARLRLRSASVSTSSQSERFVTSGGNRLGHVLDPRTGRPVPPWGSVTVVADDPAVADVVSTALLVLGPEAGYRWARHRQDVAVLFLIERPNGLTRRWNAALEQYLAKSTTLGRL